MRVCVRSFAACFGRSRTSFRSSCAARLACLALPRLALHEQINNTAFHDDDIACGTRKIGEKFTSGRPERPGRTPVDRTHSPFHFGLCGHGIPTCRGMLAPDKEFLRGEKAITPPPRTHITYSPEVLPGATAANAAAHWTAPLFFLF